MMKAIFQATVLGLVIFSGSILAKEINVIELDAALCQKLASKYGTDPSSLAVNEISTLEFCLALTLSQHPDTVPPTTPGGLIIRSQSASSEGGDTIPPKAPTNVKIVE